MEFVEQLFTIGLRWLPDDPADAGGNMLSSYSINHRLLHLQQKAVISGLFNQKFLKTRIIALSAKYTKPDPLASF